MSGDKLLDISSALTCSGDSTMRLLQSGVHISVIALWLGDESQTTTHHYVEADLGM